MPNKSQGISEGFLYTDQYQLTMAQLYFRLGLHERDVQFDHYFRTYPDYGGHQAGYCISAGLEWLIDWIQQTRPSKEDIAYLRSQTGDRGERTFSDDFLEWLSKKASFEMLTLRAIPEGRVVHPHVPLTTVTGPLAMAQILETPLLNKLNYPTLIATKAARIRDAGRGQLMLEFGLRRAQGLAANDGARAALIGGADFTSNVGLSSVLDLPPKGTHAHSMVQVFMALGGTELDAFQAYADLYPDNCLLLVDTVDTLESGIPNAIHVFEDLRRKGYEPIGIRLDSGDLAYLSLRAAQMLNEAGFHNVKIVLSNQLDELNLWQILTQIELSASQYELDAEKVIKRLVYGVGTCLITSRGAGALDGVYKLVSVQQNGKWKPAIKISESRDKVPTPGPKGLWRLYDLKGMAVADVMSQDDEDPRELHTLQLHHPIDQSKHRQIMQSELTEIEPLHKTILQDCQLRYEFPSLEEMRQQRDRDLNRLYPGVRRLINPHTYHISLTKRLWQLKQDMIESAQNGED